MTASTICAPTYAMPAGTTPAIKVSTASVMLRALLVLQTNASARRLYSNMSATLRRQPLLGRLMGFELDWALMECPRGL